MTGPIPLFQSEQEQPRPFALPLFPQNDDPLDQSVRLGERRTPDAAARILKLQLKTGLPSDLIGRNLEEIEQQAARQDFSAERFRQTSPIVAGWMAEHPDHAALARDDFTNLSKIEAITTALTRGAKIGRAQSIQGRIGYELLTNNDELDPVSKKRLESLTKEIGKEPAGRNFLENVLFQAAKIYGQMSDALPSAFLAGEVGALAGGTAGALGGSVTGPGAVLTAGAGASAGFLIGAGARMFDYTVQVEGGQAYLELSQIRGKNGESLNPDFVKAAALGVGILNGALEVLGERIVAEPFRLAAKRFAGAAARDMLVRPTMREAFAEFGKHYLTSIAGETATEVAQELTNVVAEEIGKMASHGEFATVMNDPEQRELTIRRLADIASQTANGMLLVGLPGASLNMASQVVDARKAAQRARFYTALGEGVKESKTFQRLPEALQDIVTRVTADGPIENAYVDVEKFQEYFQSQDADPREVAREIWGNTKEYDQALQNGGQLAIPMSRYATKIAPTSHNTFFSREIRIQPDALNAREAEEFLKSAPEIAGAEPAEQPTIREGLTQAIAKQIEETGRFRGADAETLATQMASFFTTTAERYGIDPDALFNHYGIRIGNGEGTDVATGQTASGAAPAGSVETIAAQSLTQPVVERRSLDSESIAARQRFQEAIAQLHAFPEQHRQGLLEALRAKPDILELKQENRGRLRVTESRKISIDLFDNANFSTFLHESGHAYLEILADLAEQHPERAEDVKAIYSWLGVSSRIELTREHHEKFARATEQYFLEGKAPSIALRRAFFRFKAWLKALYSSVRGLDVQLTKEVREVFDRMFASDAEIEAAENEAAIVPVFTDAKSAGMSEEQFAAYRQTVEDAHIQATDALRAKLMKEYLREQEQWWKEARHEVRVEVATEINEQPVYRALSLLQKGQLPDGTAVDQAFKLERSSIVELKGEEFLKRLPKPYLYSREGGVNVEQAAELLGFASGDELLQALATAQKKDQLIDAETDVRMQKRYGDMQLDGSVVEKAQESILDEYRATVIRAELRALNAKIREVKPFVVAEKNAQRTARQAGENIVRSSTAQIAGVPSEEFIKRIAQDRVSQLRVRDIRPFIYWVAARKASRAAIEAAAKADYVAAANAKQAELLNVALYREATRVKEDVDSIVEYARKLERTPAQQRLGKAGHGYLDQVNKILERFDFAPLTLTAIDRRASLAAFIQSQEEKGIDVNIPEEIQNEAFRKPWKEMSYEELTGVRDVLRHLDYLARRWNRLLKSKDERTFEALVTDVADSINDKAKQTKPRELETRLPGGQAVEAVQGFIASHRKLASLAREMDGLEDNGAVWNAIVRPLNDAADAKSILNHEITEKLHAIFTGAYSKDEMTRMYTKQHAPALGVPLTKMARLMMALNWGNEDNRTKLLAGLGVSLGRQVNPIDVQEVLSSLDERDWKFVQGIWDLIDSYWPQLKVLAERLDGIPPEKVERAVVQTRFGEFAGGYFPLVYDDRQSRIASRNVVQKQASKTIRAADARASTKAGARIERVSGVRLPLRLDFGVITEHFEDIALDITHTEVLNDVNRILRSGEIEQAIRDHYGDVVFKQVLASLEDIAAGNTPAQTTGDKSVNWVRTGTTIAGLGWSFTTSLMQPLGLTQSMVRIGPKWVARGMARWLRDAASMENTAKWIRSKSQFMVTRTDSQVREIAEIRNKIGLARGRAATYLDMGLSKASLEKIDLQDLEDSFFWLITRMQLVADIPTWLGAYEKALSSSVDESTAIALADQAVIDAQGSGQIKDLAQIQRGNVWLKLWTNFYSFFSTTWNLQVESFKRTDFKSPVSIGRFAVDHLLLSTVPAVVGGMLVDALRGRSSDEPWWERALKYEVAYVSGWLVLVRELSSAAQGFSGYEGPAGARIFAELGKLIQQVKQGDSDAALWKELNKVSGILFHYPAVQVQRTVEGLMALTEGRTHNPTALLFGPPKK